VCDWQLVHTQTAACVWRASPLVLQLVDVEAHRPLHVSSEWVHWLYGI
jgi:hypothetical protein